MDMSSFETMPSAPILLNRQWQKRCLVALKYPETLKLHTACSFLDVPAPECSLDWRVDMLINESYHTCGEHVESPTPLSLTTHIPEFGKAPPRLGRLIARLEMLSKVVSLNHEGLLLLLADEGVAHLEDAGLDQAAHGHAVDAQGHLQRLHSTLIRIAKLVSQLCLDWIPIALLRWSMIHHHQNAHSKPHPTSWVQAGAIMEDDIRQIIQMKNAMAM